MSGLNKCYGFQYCNDQIINFIIEKIYYFVQTYNICICVSIYIQKGFDELTKTYSY